jgi:hypothetical protein
MHPGIWLAFGDINGHDFWRNGADIWHDKFIAEPEAGADGISFSVQNLYEAGGSTLCRDETSIRINSEKGAFVLQWDCRLIALDQALVFGDQEEMGLGFRVATPLAVRNGGQIRNADERVNEKEIWGKPSTWCDYTGQVDGRHAGIALLPHPENPRPSRFHARDYGLLVANPFALKAFGEPDSDPVRVNAGESLRLRFQVVLHDGEWDPPGGGAEPRQQ